MWDPYICVAHPFLRQRHPNVGLAAYARHMVIEPGGIAKTTTEADLPLTGDPALIVDLDPSGAQPAADTGFQPVLLDIGPDGKLSVF